MPEQNVELVRSLIDRWNRGDRTADPDIFHPEVEFLPLRTATEGVYRGAAGIEAFIADTLEVFERFEMHLDLEEIGEHVLAWGNNHVRARGSGIETDVEIGGVFAFRDGKVIRWEDFGSRDKALESISPSPAGP
jgi:ketosteroid isomerase-like protein